MRIGYFFISLLLISSKNLKMEVSLSILVYASVFMLYVIAVLLHVSAFFVYTNGRVDPDNNIPKC